MLLTNIIPPRSQELKDALNVFNRFLEEPHSDPNERLEIFIGGGRGCGKSTIAAGMMLKAHAETKGWGFCIKRTTSSSVKVVMPCFQWALCKIGVPREEVSISLQSKTLHLKGREAKITFTGIDMGAEQFWMKTRGIPNKRFALIEDAHQFSRNEYEAILDSLDLRENPIIITTFNPSPSRSHWLNEYAADIYKHNGQQGKWVFKPIYWDMDTDMIGNSFFEKAEECRKCCPELYVKEYLGIPMDR